MIVVSDTGPINYLVLIGQIELLAVLFREVVIPATVRQELSSPSTGEAVRSWIEAAPAWVTVRAPTSPHPGIPTLGLGESHAIALARELGAPLLCDDSAARRAALHAGLDVSGTLGCAAGGACALAPGNRRRTGCPCTHQLLLQRRVVREGRPPSRGDATAPQRGNMTDVRFPKDHVRGE